MESIEADYTSLAGVLPKTEYQELDNNVLGRVGDQRGRGELEMSSDRATR
jgi:hypothetical protein